MGSALGLFCVALALIAQWKSEEIINWFTIKPCQNDVSFRNSLWSATVSRDLITLVKKL